MHVGEAMSFSLQALRQNPVRSVLTGLGMVIGTASVILVVTISLTSQSYILEQIEGVGSNMIFASYEVSRQLARLARISLNWRISMQCGSSLRTASWPRPGWRRVLTIS